MSKHGGVRSGAGRPLKWDFEHILTVGLACEVKWRTAVKAAIGAKSDRHFSVESDIQSLWDVAQRVPVSNRRQWYDGEEGEIHRADIKTELHSLNGTPDEDGPPPRVISILAKPPRGTRKLIIAEIAEQFGLRESTVDNLWQAYRRFEREMAERQQSANS